MGLASLSCYFPTPTPREKRQGRGGGQRGCPGKAGLELPFGHHKLLLKHSPGWGWEDPALAQRSVPERG